jgi:hypothetical protein
MNDFVLPFPDGRTPYIQPRRKTVIEPTWSRRWPRFRSARAKAARIAHDFSWCSGSTSGGESRNASKSSRKMT